MVGFWHVKSKNCAIFKQCFIASICSPSFTNPVIPYQSRIADFSPEHQPFPVHIFKTEGIGYFTFITGPWGVLNMYMQVREKGVPGIADISQDGSFLHHLVNGGEGLGKLFFRSFSIFILNSAAHLFDVFTEPGQISCVDLPASLAAPHLPFC